jgi:ABC-type thiamin/hydroxymethylpyrimidine transport system permease subunit
LYVVVYFCQLGQNCARALEPHRYNAPMRFSLRTLMILAALIPGCCTRHPGVIAITAVFAACLSAALFVESAHAFPSLLKRWRRPH